MGSVWRAEHLDLGTPAAVKLIDETFAQSPEALTRFRREAQAAASLRSANVVQILDYGVDGDTPYIAMELLEGESLADRIEHSGRMEPETCAAILLQVSKALARAHEQGIVHRDLKPDNVFLSRDGDDVVAKVLDFGIAKRTGVLQTASDMATRTGSLMGTPYYMSPEQASGRREVDHRTDIWAFAVIAYECLTGRRPFDDSNLGGLLLSICTENPPPPSQLAPLPPGFDAWFARCTAKEPAARFENIRGAAAELCRVLGAGVPSSRLAASAGTFGPKTAVVNQVSQVNQPGVVPWADSRAASVATPGAVMMPVGGPNPGTLNPATLEPGARRRPSLLLLLSGAIALLGIASVVIAFIVRELPKDKTLAANSSSPSLELPKQAPSASASAAITVAPVEPLVVPATSASATTASATTASATQPSSAPKPRTATRPPPSRPAPLREPAPATRAGEPQQVPRMRPQDRLERDLGF